MKKEIRGRGLRHSYHKDEFNPMEGVANMADAMLVFACGLMMAVIMNWNVDIGYKAEQVDLSVSQDVTSEMENMDQGMEDIMNSDSSYEKMGVLYKDPITGKMYMITEEE